MVLKNGNFTRCLKRKKGLLALYNWFSLFKSYLILFLNIDTDVTWVLFENCHKTMRIYQTIETEFDHISKYLVKFVKNIPLRVVILTPFSVFEYVFKYSLSCFIYHLVSQAYNACKELGTRSILYFPIAFNALCLPHPPPPKFCINHCCEILLHIPKIVSQYFMQNLGGKQSAL